MSGGLARWQDRQARLLVGIARAAHTARLTAAGAGLLQPEVAVLTAGDGRFASGLFSEAASVLGLLDDFERRSAGYAGVRVRFDKGLYYDAAAGPNWWEYYFEEVRVGAADGRQRLINHHFHDYCANRVERELSKERAADLVQRYVNVKPAVRDVADAFVSTHWNDQVIGVHYRGTDKSIDARRVPYEEVEHAVRERMAAGPQARIFVATDEQPFVDFMRVRFPGRVLARDMFRSGDGRPIDVFNGDGNYRKGLDAVVDCLLLSRAHTLIRTASNLSLFATLFNSGLPVRLLNPEP